TEKIQRKLRVKDEEVGHAGRDGDIQKIQDSEEEEDDNGVTKGIYKISRTTSLHSVERNETDHLSR
ncbi:hypothetical protein scyTo_0025155, partial [Scyliorhinus torazame]|nr:hypothetical protein [Scyliorhinus torazame]